jgi:hypothetical protein
MVDSFQQQAAAALAQARDTPDLAATRRRAQPARSNWSTRTDSTDDENKLPDFVYS